MIIDTSVVVAILRQELEAQSFSETMEAASACRISAASYLEAAIVIDSRRDAIASREFDALISDNDIGVYAVDERRRALRGRPIAISGKAADIPRS